MSYIPTSAIVLCLFAPVLSAQIYTAATVAGTSRLLDGGPATLAPLRSPHTVAVDAAGNIYIADTDDNRVRKVNQQGIISTICGNGLPGFSGDRGKASAAQLSAPVGLAADGAGNLYIAERDNYRVRRISPDGTINTVAGNAVLDFPETEDRRRGPSYSRWPSR
jgi:DNA-binding beta-propeller fold protein YncE